MLIAEDLLLLLTDDETGKLVASASEVDVALGGALLVELTLMQRLDLAGPSEQVRKGHLVVRDASATSDPLLDEALAMVAWPAAASCARRARRSLASSPATTGRPRTPPTRTPSVQIC
jgi:hypothetical protein